jgi:hypothetical protein
MSYATLAATAKRMIEAKGKDVTLVRIGKAAADANAPHRGSTPSETTYTVKAVEKAFTTKQIDGERIRAGDKLFVLAEDSRIAANGFIPTLADKLRLGGRDWSILDVSAKVPGDVALTYEIHARAA